MGAVSHQCEDCGETVAGPDLEAFGNAFIAHARQRHPEWPYPDIAIRNFAEATQRLTGGRERLDEIGDISIHAVSENRLDDWLSFFDHDAFADNPGWAACYCAEPHLMVRGTAAGEDEPRTWQHNRETMIELLRSGRSFGYLAYVDGRPAAWINASKRSSYALYRLGPDATPSDGTPPDNAVVGISCFVVAPPYRQHGLAARLLERVLADARDRGVAWVEAYPLNDSRPDASGNFHGPRALFDGFGFEPVEQLERYTVVRRPAP